MIPSLTLLAIGVLIWTVGPRLAAATWPHQAPRLAIFTWQALTVSGVAVFVLAGVTLLIPVTALADDLSAIVHACVASIVTAYGSSQLLPGRLLGSLLAGVLPAWIALCALRVLGGGWRSRRRLHRSLSLVMELDASIGAAVLDSPSPAAFCVPGRNSQIVITRGTLERLSRHELRGVLAHEAAHLRGRHDLPVALSKIFSLAFPRVPLFQAAAVQTRQLIELLADDQAAKAVDRVSLASAIVSLAEMRAPTAAMAMAEQAVALRVRRLLAPARPLATWRYRLCAVGALVLAAAPVLIAGLPTLSAAFSDLCQI